MREALQRWVCFAAGVAVQAGWLWTVEAGKGVHYQHARPEAHPWVAGLVVAAAMVGVWKAGWGWRWLWALPVAAAASREVERWAVESVFTALTQAGALGWFWLAAREWAWRSRDWKAGRLVACAAVGTALAAGGLNVWVYERQPHLQDEVAYLHQARTFAAGRVMMGPPAVREAFEYFLLEVRPGGAYAVMPPGHAMALAPAARFGLEWAVNPVLGGLNVWLLWLVLRRVYGESVGMMGAMLLAASPWHLFLAMSFMNHTGTLTALLGAVLGVLSGGWAGSVGAGLAVGWVGLNRPLDGVVLGVGLLGWTILRGRKWMGAAGGLAAMGGVGVFYHAVLTGRWWVTPLSEYMDRVYGPGQNSLGFGAGRGLGWALDPFPGHGWRDVLVNGQLNLAGLNGELFGWAGGSLVFVLGLAVLGRPQKEDRWMWGLMGATVAIYSLYWFSGGPDFGPRYWYLMLGPAVALTARGMEELRARRGDGVMVLALLMTASAWMTHVPWRAWDKYRGYLGMTGELAKLAEFGRSVVVVRGAEFPDYAAVAWRNAPDWDGEVVWAREADGTTLEKLRAAYPGRRVWVVEGPSVTGRGYRVVERW